MLQDLKLKPAALEKRLPPLNRQSDVMWTVWKTITPNPNDLRYIGRDLIVNDDTRGIMNDVFARGPTRKPVTWPGVRFGIETEEGQALLGTPNGLATAYIMADRARDLGKRKLSVRIWASETDPPNQGYRMLWDLVASAALVSAYYYDEEGDGESGDAGNHVRGQTFADVKAGTVTESGIKWQRESEEMKKGVRDDVF